MAFVTMNGQILPAHLSGLPQTIDLQPADDVPADQSVLGLRVPSAGSWHQGESQAATLPARPSGRNSDTPKLIDVRNIRAWAHWPVRSAGLSDSLSQQAHTEPDGASQDGRM